MTDVELLSSHTESADLYVAYERFHNHCGTGEARVMVFTGFCTVHALCLRMFTSGMIACDT